MIFYVVFYFIKYLLIFYKIYEMTNFLEKSKKNLKKIQNLKNIRFTQKIQFFKGGAFKFPKNEKFIKQFISEFYLSLQNIHPDSIKLFQKMIHSNDKILQKIQILQKTISAENLNMDAEFLISNIYFIILTYKNDKYNRFIKRYFGLNISKFTNMIIKLLFSTRQTGGEGSGQIVPMENVVKISYKSICITSLVSFLFYSFFIFLDEFLMNL